MTTRSTQLLVIGGGATGLGVAWDACLRGLSVIVVEQGDLGQGTSGRYHGLLHSGGRYVLSDPNSAAECRRENEVLRRLIPHAIEPTGGLFLSTNVDPAGYAEEWLAACRRLDLPVAEISAAEALRREPLLTPRLSRIFATRDAALDSFELLESLARAVTEAGGTVLTRHRVAGLVPHDGGLLARVVSLRDPSAVQLEARFVVNAAGPFAGQVASMAGARLPMSLGKGTLLAMASRLTHTVLSRCKPPHDGDIIVPIGTVCVLGTTDVAVRSPADLAIEPWEVDFLLSEAQVLIPSIRRHRVLRAWAGIRALHRPEAAKGSTRALPRSHVLVDHGPADNVPGLVSIIGGKLTTFRRMAEDVVDHLASPSGLGRSCRTADTPLPSPHRRNFALGARPESVRRTPPDERIVVCECEAVLQRDLDAALSHSQSKDLDDLRRDLRLGMGPCQATFCGYRAAAIAAAALPDPQIDGGLAEFAQERWRGLRPLAWGRGLRQAELLRRVQIELLGAESVAGDTV